MVGCGWTFCKLWPSLKHLTQGPAQKITKQKHTVTERPQSLSYLICLNTIQFQGNPSFAKRRKLRCIELDSKQAFKQHFGGWLVTTDAFDLPRGVPGVQVHLPYLPLAQTSCRRRRTLITYYSNTPDHDSLRNPCWPVAATTEDQNRHKMAPVSDGLVWTP